MTRGALARWPLPVLLLATLLVGCAAPRPTPVGQGGPAQPAPPGQTSRTLVLVGRQEPPAIAYKPLRTLGLTAGSQTRLFNASLSIIDAAGVPRPYLAEALPQLNTDTWRVLADGRMETIYRLNAQAVWHDDVPLTAEDFVFSWQVYTTPELSNPGSPPVVFMEEVLAVDARTVLVRWRRAYQEAGQLDENFPPLPRHLLERPFRTQPDSLENLPFWQTGYVGLGPYRLERWEAGAFIEGVAFDRHVLGRPRIERVRLVYIPDPNAVVANLLAGQVHITIDDSIRFQQGLIIKRAWEPVGAGTVLVYPALWRWLQFQQRGELARPRVLLDARVRRAIAHSIDKQALNDVLFEGQGILADTMIPPTVDYYPTVERSVVKHSYDLRRAEQLMNQASWERGPDSVYTSPAEGPFATELNVLGSAQNEAELSIIAAGLRVAGYQISEVVWAPAQAQDSHLRATFPGLSITSGGSGESVVPNFVRARIPSAETRWSGTNRAGWSAPPEYDRLAEAFVSTLDRGERARLLAQLMKIFTEDVAVLSLYFNPTVVAHVAALRGPQPVTPDGDVAWNVHEWQWR